MKGIRFVYPKILAQIPDYSTLGERSLQRRLAEIRDFASKSPRQPVTVSDVAEFLGSDVQEIADLLFPTSRTQ